jgi:hypothetical protein
VTIDLGPAASRRHVAAELRRYRRESNLSVEDVADALSRSYFVVNEIDYFVTTRNSDLEKGIDDEGVTHTSEVAAPCTRPTLIMHHIELQPFARFTKVVAEFDVYELRFLVVMQLGLRPLSPIQVCASGFSEYLRASATELLLKALDSISTSFMASEGDGETLARLGLQPRLPAKGSGSLASLAPVPFSRQTSARDCMAGLAQSLRERTLLPVICPNRGMAVAA